MNGSPDWSKPPAAGKFFLNAWLLNMMDSIGTPKKKNTLDARVEYTSQDSMVMTGKGIAHMYGSGELKYQALELTADYIRVCMDSSTLYASGVLDTIENEWTGLPVFKDANDSYESKEITYNLKTQKGIIRHVVTEQGEGFLIADKTKKTADNTIFPECIPQNQKHIDALGQIFRAFFR